MRRHLLLLSAIPLLVGCSDEGGTPGPDPEPEPDEVSFSAELSVAPADETIQCQFVTMPDDRGPMAVRHMDHTYTAGSHHFLLFRTDIATAADIPEGGDQLTECEEGDAEWMGHVRGVVYAAQDPEGTFSFPDGVGMTFEPGAVMLMQSHYLNTSSEALEARIDVSLELTDPVSVEEEAGVLFYYNPQIAVPPMGDASATLHCPVPADVSLAFVSSHMHKRGTFFEATTDDEAANELLGGTLYETEEWAEPVPRVFDGATSPMLRAGSTISYTCDFANPDPFTVVQGPSADTNEMCMFVGMYWPKQDDNFEWCYDGVTDAGGTLSAAETLMCLVECGGGDPECAGGCWQNACPNAPMKVSSMRDCLPSCLGQCVGGLDSESCSSCAADTCPAEYDAFMAATCD